MILCPPPDQALALRSRTLDGEADMKKLIVFALATSFLAASANAAKPSDAWFFCKGFLGPQVCKIFK